MGIMRVSGLSPGKENGKGRNRIEQSGISIAANLNACFKV